MRKTKSSDVRWGVSFMDYFAWPKSLFASQILKTILWQLASAQLSSPFLAPEKGDLSLDVK